MPIFEYRCRECGEKFETIVNTSKSRPVCKHCGGKKLDQLLSVFAVSNSGASAATEAGPCGACGAARRGMCQGMS